MSEDPDKLPNNISQCIGADEFYREQRKRDTNAVEITQPAIDMAKTLCGSGLPPQFVAKAMGLKTADFERLFGAHYYPQLAANLNTLLNGVPEDPERKGVWERAHKSDRLAIELMQTVGKMSTAVQESEIEVNQSLSQLGRRKAAMEALDDRRRAMAERDADVVATS